MSIHRHGWFTVLLFGVAVAGCATSAAAAADDALFERHEFLTNVAAKRQTVLSGFFIDGPTAGIAVVHVEESDRGHVQMFGLVDSAWVPVLSAKLSPGVLFVDVARIKGRDRLITYQHGRVHWFDPESAAEQLLVEVEMSFNATSKDAIPYIDVTHDLNHDGRDDLLMPQVDGFWVSVQSSDGSFTEAVKLGPPEPFRNESVGNIDTGAGPSDPSRTYGEVGIMASTLHLFLSRVYTVDYNLDGRSDLVFWNEDHFDAYLQEENGLFSSQASAFVTDVPFDSDGVYSYAHEFKDQGVLSMLLGLGPKTRRTVLHTLRDVNGDGVADLVTLTLSGRSFARQRSVYAVHLGNATPAGVVFHNTVSATIRPRGRAGAMQPWGYSSQVLDDLDGDGQVDIMFKDVNVGLGGMGRALIGNSVAIDLEFYRGDNGIYPDSSAVRRKIKRFAPFAGFGNVFFPVVLLGDVNGDGRSDLVAGHSPQELHVFPGVASPDLFARKPLKLKVALPADERNVWLADLNEDSKKDIVVQLGPSGHAPDEPHRVVLLIAH